MASVQRRGEEWCIRSHTNIEIPIESQSPIQEQDEIGHSEINNMHTIDSCACCVHATDSSDDEQEVSSSTAWKGREGNTPTPTHND